jgi:radical SAM-linked protein
VAFTQGFNPRPKLSFGPPLPVGATGSSEFVEIELVRASEPSEIASKLGGFLPAGVDIIECAALRTRGSAAAQACAAEYEIRNLTGLATLEASEVEQRIAALRRRSRAEVVRGESTKEVRPDERVLSLEARFGEGSSLGSLAPAQAGSEEPVTLHTVLALGEEGALRPIDLVRLMYGEDGSPAELAVVHRIALYRCPSTGGLERM